MSSSKPAHRALFVPELISLILKPTCDGFGPHPAEGLALATLHAATLVCQAWSGSALRWLWRDLPGIRPALTLVAPLVRGRGGMQEFGDPPAKLNLERLFYYTSLVKGLHQESESPAFDLIKPGFDDSSISELEEDSDGFATLPSRETLHVSSETIMQFLSFRPDDGHLFPNLKRLAWQPWLARDVAHFLALASPQVSPRLAELHLRIEVLDDEKENARASAAACKALTWLSKYQSLQLEAINLAFMNSHDDGEVAAAIQALVSNQSGLQSLIIDVDSDDDLGVPVSLGKEIMCNRPQLRELGLGIMLFESKADADTFLSEIPTLCPHLIVLELGVVLDTVEPVFLPFSSISPFLQLRNLFQLRLTMPYACPLLPPQIRMMGKAWPDLEEFNMNKIGDWSDIAANGGRPTSLSSLAVFAESFSSNFHRIYLDLEVDKRLPRGPIKVPFSKAFSVMNCGWYTAVPTRRVQAVGKYLAALCPYDTAVVGGDGWDKVADVVRAEHDARRLAEAEH